MKISLYFLALFSLSQSSVLVKMAGAPPDVIGFWRLLFASVLLISWGLVRGDLINIIRKPPHQIRFIFLTALFFFAHLWTYFYAAQNTKIANAMIIFATNPLFTAAGAWFFYKVKFTRRLGLAYLLALAGIVLLVHNSIQWSPSSVKGDLSALVSALFFAGYLLLVKKSRMSFSNTNYSGILYLLTCVCFGLSGLLHGVNFFDYPATTWWSIAGTVLLPTLLGHSLISYLINYMDLNLMTCGKLIEPVLSTLAAYLFFSEIPNTGTGLAFLLTASAVFVLFWPFGHSSRLKPQGPQ